MSGSTDPEWIVDNLFLDSLLFLRVLPAEIGSLVDIGSGAGVPGIPIRIVKPGLRTVVLIESRRRRVSFLSTVVRELNLQGTIVIANRIVEVPDQWQGALDAAVARCAGPAETVVALGAGFVKSTGIVVISGSPDAGKTGGGRRVVVSGLSEGHSRQFHVFEPPWPASD